MSANPDVLEKYIHLIFSALLDALIQWIDQIDEKQGEISRILRSLSIEKGSTSTVEDLFDKPAFSVIELQRLEKIWDKNLKRKKVSRDRLVILKNQIWDNEKLVTSGHLGNFHLFTCFIFILSKAAASISDTEIWALEDTSKTAVRTVQITGARDILSLVCQATRSGTDHATLIIFFTNLRKKINSVQFKILYWLLYKYVSSRTNTIKVSNGTWSAQLHSNVLLQLI